MKKKLNIGIRTLVCLLALVFARVSNAQITNYTPTISPSSICGSGTATVTLSSSQTGVSYGLVASTNTTAIVGSPISGTGSALNFPTGTVTVTTTYAVVGIIVGTATVVMNPYATVTVNPLPAVSITPTSTAICKGQTETLTASGALNYTWTPSGTMAATETVAPTNTTTPTSYTVKGIDVNGCTGKAVTSITVNPVPTIAIAGGPGFGGVCPGTLTTYTASGASTYTWSANAGSATTNTVTVSPSVTTIYSVTGTNASGCTGTKTKTLTVNPSVTVTISGPPFICNGLAGTLTAAGATTYSWNTGAITTSIVVSPTVTTTYSVIGTGGFGTCPGTASFTLNVTPTPQPTVTISGSTVTCSGSPDLLTAGGATTYTWAPGGATTATISPAPTVSTTYTVTGMDASGCSNTHTINVTVNPLPPVIANNTSICIGNTATLTAGGANTYVWSTGATTNTVAVTPTVTTTYSVTGTSTVTGCSKQAVATVTVNTLPTLTVTPQTICLAATATLVANPTTLVSYSWSPGLSSTFGSTVTGSPTVTTTYSVSATNTNGCVGSTTAQINVVTNLTVTATASSSVTCLGSSVTLTGLGASSYSWTSSGGSMSGGTGTTVTVTPAGTSTTYTVNGSSGTCTATPYVLSVNVNTLPTVGSNASPSNTVCTGSSITLSGSGASTYTWTGGITNGTAFTATTSANYTVTGTDVNGCKNTAIESVTTNTLPTIAIATTAGGGGICPGASATLTASGATTYTWVNTTSTNTVIVVSPTVTTQYTVTGTDANGCSNIKTRNVTVKPVPTATISGSTPLCIGQTATLTAVPTNTVAVGSYAWIPTGSTTASTTTSPTITASYTVLIAGTGFGACTDTVRTTVTVNSLPIITAPASPKDTACMGSSVTLTGSGASTYTWTGGVTNGTAFTATATTIYTVTGTDVNGCTNTTKDTITVNSLPSVTASVTTPTVCAGTKDTVMATGAVSYTWTPGNSHLATISGVLHSTVTLTLTGTDVKGCKNSDTLTIIVNPLPTLTVTPQTICPMATATLIANPTTLASYTWSPGLSSTSGSAVTGSPAVTTDYTVSATGSDGCVGTKTTSIIVVSSLTVSAVSSATAVCVGNSVNLTATGASSYTWTSSDVTVNGNTGTSVTGFPISSPTTYTVNGSSGTCTATPYVLSVNVNTLPVITASASPSNTVCTGASVTLTGGGAITYTWTSGGITNGVAFTPTATSVYTVYGTDANNCTDSSSIQVIVNCATGINKLNNTSSVSIYPNPTDGNLFVRLDNAENASVEVYNTLGQLVLSKPIHSTTESINLENLNQGVYTVRVIQNNIYLHHSTVILNK